MDATRHQVPVTAGFPSLVGLLLAATVGTTLAQDRSPRRVIPGSATGTAQQTARQPARTAQSPNKRLPRSRLQTPDLRVQKLDPKLKAVLLKWEQASSRVKTLKGEIYRYHREFVFNTEKRQRAVHDSLAAVVGGNLVAGHPAGGVGDFQYLRAIADPFLGVVTRDGQRHLAAGDPLAGFAVAAAGLLNR